MKKIILFTVITALVIVSSGLMYSFAIPENYNVISKNVCTNNEINIMENNTKKIFIINISMNNEPAGNIYLKYSYSLGTSINNTSLKNSLSNNFLTVTSYMILHPDNTDIYYHYGTFHNPGGVRCSFYDPINETTNTTNGYNFNQHFGIKPYKNYTLSIVILATSRVSNPGKPVFANFTLKNISLLDKTHGYSHKLDFINGKAYYIKPKASLISLTN